MLCPFETYRRQVPTLGEALKSRAKKGLNEESRLRPFFIEKIEGEFPLNVSEEFQARVHRLPGPRIHQSDRVNQLRGLRPLVQILVADRWQQYLS